MSKKELRALATLKRLAAEFIIRESNRRELITVTDLTLDKNQRNGIIYVSVLPEKNERATIAFLNRRRRELGDFLKNRIKIRAIPHFNFATDDGNKHFNRVTELLIKKKND